jgi:hypothetical protein
MFVLEDLERAQARGASIHLEIIGYGTLDEAAHTIYFTFNNPDGQFMNAYAFDPATKNWTSVMRQKSKGPWSLFAEDKFTPLASKS